MTLFWQNGQLLMVSTGTFFPNWPSEDSHHRIDSRDSPEQTTVIAFLSRALAFLSWGPKAVSDRWLCHLDSMLCQGATVSFPFQFKLIPRGKVGHAVLTPCTALFIGATASWYPSPWTAGPNSIGPASDFKQQWEEACLRHMPSTSLDGDELKCESHCLIHLQCV